MNILELAILKKMVGGGGGSGTDNYNDLSNLPQINGETLAGNKTAENLGLQDALTFDSAPTEDSTNPVESGGVYNALAGKQDNLTFDDDPTENSTNPVKSGGVYSALAGKQDNLTFDGVYNASTNKAATESTVTNAIAGLDVSDFSVDADETISSISETDGKINVTKQDIAIASNQVTAMTGYTKPSSAPATPAIQTSDTANQAFGKLEFKADTNQTNISSVEDMICDTEFSTSTAYSKGDVVTYEHVLYKFNAAHSAGAWNSSQVDEVSAVDLISSGSETDSVTSKEIYVTKPINQPDTWETKTWTGLTSFRTNCIWSDGENIYYSYDSDQYVLDKSTSTWSAKNWSGLTLFFGNYIWTDGENIYYSLLANQYVLNKSTSTWTTKTWSGLTSFNGNNIWTDGENIYYSYDSDQYVLDKSTSTWSTKTWTGLTSFRSNNIWTDGNDIYYSGGLNQQYVLNKSTSTWETKTWNNRNYITGDYIWTDGENIYDSLLENQYVFNKSTSTWTTKAWTGLTSFTGYDIWTDGENIYCSHDSDQYVLKRPLKTTKIPDVKNNAQLTALMGDINSVLEAVL